MGLPTGAGRGLGGMTQGPSDFSPVPHPLAPCPVALAAPQDSPLPKCRHTRNPGWDGACLESSEELGAPSSSLGALRNMGPCLKLHPRAAPQEQLSRPQCVQVVLGSWLADEIMETDYNHLNNSWSPRL